MKGYYLFGLLLAAAACGGDSSTSSINGGTGFKLNPCSPSGTLQLGSAQSTRVDCSAGGTTVTLAGNGASYMIIPQFPTDQGTDAGIPFNIAASTTASASIARMDSVQVLRALAVSGAAGGLPPIRRGYAQQAAERAMMARGRGRGLPSSLYSIMRSTGVLRSVSRAVVPALGSVRTFHVASSFTAFQYKDVRATLAYAGANVLIYLDSLAPANGFTSSQLNAFGALFDQTLYPIDTTAFGQPTDLDGNGHVIMLMSPVVNGDTPTATCATQGYVAGFFDPTDFDGASDPFSNQGEVFYSIVPDPNGQFSCAHQTSDLGLDVPATFLHELQHLIFFSQHVVVSNTGEGASWMDEGLSITAEELGSIYYENKCPVNTAIGNSAQCRSSPAQLFPDSAQGFISSFLYDSYQYALGPDTASVTLHDDSQDGFSWRGGDWLLMRWLGDQFGTAVYKKFEKGPADGVTDIEAGTGQSFPTILANFGISLYADSLPGLPRSTSANNNRFLSRNVSALWARLFTTDGPASDVPRARPLVLTSIGSDTTVVATMRPGAMKFYRLDTQANQATVTVRFAAPGGAALSPALKPQLAIYRLPAGQ